MNSKSEKIKFLSIEDGMLTIWLDDGRVISLPLAWYPTLREALPAERNIWQPSGAGRGIHWPALDYDLSVEGLLQGLKEHPNARHYSRQARVKNQTTRQAPDLHQLRRRIQSKATKRKATVLD